MLYSNFNNSYMDPNTSKMDSYKIWSSQQSACQPYTSNQSNMPSPQMGSQTARTNPPPPITGESVMRDTTMVPLIPPQNPAMPTTVQSPYYTAGFLTNYIGRTMRVEFLIGTTGPLVDRIGRLLEVGASYIVLEPIDFGGILMCDLYSIKFVSIFKL